MDILKKNNEKDKNKNKKRGPQITPGRQFFNNIIGAILIFIAIVAAYSLVSEGRKEVAQISLSELARNISAGEISKITVEGDKLTAEFKDKSIKESKKEKESSLSETLSNYGVPTGKLSLVAVEIKNESGLGFWLLNVLPFALPIIFFIIIFWLISRQVKERACKLFRSASPKPESLTQMTKTSELPSKTWPE